nr:hypothetical protein CE91St29_13500 [Corynebacterium striatum]
MQHDSDSLSYGIWTCAGVETKDTNTPRRRLLKALAHLDSRGLTRTIGAQQTQHFSTIHMEAEPVYGSLVPVGFDYVRQLESWGSIESCIHEGLV